MVQNFLDDDDNTVEAVQLTAENLEDVEAWIPAAERPVTMSAGAQSPHALVFDEGRRARFGDWIVKDARDEFWVFGPDEFEDRYRAVDE